MDERRGVRLAGGVAVIAGVGLIVLALLGQSAPAKDEFAIAGEIDGLFPGAVGTLAAPVTNPKPFTIRVVSTRVTVRDASSACPASMIEIEAPEAAIEIPTGVTRGVPLDVRMALAAPDACKGATWPLEFSGMAVGAWATGTTVTNLIHLSPGQAALLALGAFLVLAGLIALGRDRRRRSRRAT